jgi:hypothetical protein
MHNFFSEKRYLIQAEGVIILATASCNFQIWVLWYLEMYAVLDF